MADTQGAELGPLLLTSLAGIVLNFAKTSNRLHVVHNQIQISQVQQHKSMLQHISV